MAIKLLNQLAMAIVPRDKVPEVLSWLEERPDVEVQLSLPFSDGETNGSLLYFLCNKAASEELCEYLVDEIGLQRKHVAVVPLALIKEAAVVPSPIVALAPETAADGASPTALTEATSGEETGGGSMTTIGTAEDAAKKSAVSKFYASVKARIAVENMLGKSLESVTESSETTNP